jgi:hypothetical protein
MEIFMVYYMNRELKNQFNQKNQIILMKAIALISAVIFIGLTLAVSVIVYNAGMPVVLRMQHAAAVEKMKGVFSEMDKIIEDVASEGNGSKRTVDLRFDIGTFTVNGSSDKLHWDFDSESMIASPRTSVSFGNVVFGSKLETSAYEGDYQGTQTYVLENEHIKAYFRKIGSPSSPQSYNTNQLLLAIYQKDLNQWMPFQSMELSLDNADSSKTGTGYTVLEQAGTDLPYATVSAYMSSAYANYFLNFTLESGTDFLTIEGSQA